MGLAASSYEQFFGEARQLGGQDNLIYLMEDPIEGHLDEPSFIIEFSRHLRVFELVVAISADNDKVLGVMSPCGVKMMNLKIRVFVPLEEPEVAHLAMPLIELPKQGSQAGRRTFSRPARSSGGTFSFAGWRTLYQTPKLAQRNAALSHIRPLRESCQLFGGLRFIW